MGRVVSIQQDYEKKDINKKSNESEPVYADKHLSSGGLQLIKAEWKGVSPCQIPQVGPLWVGEVHPPTPLLNQPQENLLQGETYGLVPLGGLGLPATSQRHLQQVSKMVVVL